MNISTTRNIAFGIFALTSMLAVGGCSQKPSSEEVAAQVKAALAEEKAKEQAAAPAPAPAPVVEAAVAPKPAAKAKPVAHEKHAQAEHAPVKAICGNCGVVVSVKEIEQAGKGSGLGAVAGAVAGGVVGHQVGQGSGRDLATAAGVVGGAIAGHKIEQNVKKAIVYDVTVKMETGEERVLRHETAPGVVAGDKVKVENDHVVRQ